MGLVVPGDFSSPSFLVGMGGAFLGGGALRAAGFLTSSETSSFSVLGVVLEASGSSWPRLSLTAVGVSVALV